MGVSSENHKLDSGNMFKKMAELFRERKSSLLLLEGHGKEIKNPKCSSPGHRKSSGSDF